MNITQAIRSIADHPITLHGEVMPPAVALRGLGLAVVAESDARGSPELGCAVLAPLPGGVFSRTDPK